MMHIANCINIVRYIFVFVINLLILLFLHSYFNFVVMIVLIVLPVISIGMTAISSRYITVDIESGCVEAVVDDPFLLNIVVSNQSVCPMMNVDVNLHMENALFHESGKHMLTVPAYAYAADVVNYEITEKFIGVLEVSVQNFYVTDWLGFVRLKKKSNSSCEIRVFPDGEFSVELDSTSFNSGMSEADESKKKGSDFSEPADIRQYQPGDRIRDVHWKLSAGRQDLMVKERQSMSSDQIIVCVELTDDEQNVLNDILKAAYGLGKYLLSEDISFTLCYWSVTRDDLVETAIENSLDLKDWMNGLFYEKSYRDHRLAQDMMQKMFDDNKKFLVITADGEKVKGYISGQEDQQEKEEK